MAVNVVFISSFCSDLTAIAFAKTDDVDDMLYEDLTRQLLISSVVKIYTVKILIFGWKNPCIGERMEYREKI